MSGASLVCANAPLYRSKRDVGSTPVDIAQLVMTSLVALVGLYLAHSYRRQQRVLVADRRLDAYGELWALLEVARPTRMKDVSVDLEGPLARDEARTLYRDMTHWYSDQGTVCSSPTPPRVSTSK